MLDPFGGVVHAPKHEEAGDEAAAKKSAEDKTCAASEEGKAVDAPEGKVSDAVEKLKNVANTSDEHAA